jgi:hypothetical protein
VEQDGAVTLRGFSGRSVHDYAVEQRLHRALLTSNAAAMSQPDRQLPKGDLSCLVDLVPDMASLMQAERNAGAKDLVILGGLGLDSPLPKTEWEQLGAR